MAALPPPSPVTLAEAQAQLRNWLNALEAASTGGSYSIGGRTLTRQDIPDIRAEIQRWHNAVAAEDARLRGVKRALGAQACWSPPGAGSGGIISSSMWEDWRT